MFNRAAEPETPKFTLFFVYLISYIPISVGVLLFMPASADIWGLVGFTVSFALSFVIVIYALAASPKVGVRFFLIGQLIALGIVFIFLNGVIFLAGTVSSGILLILILPSCLGLVLFNMLVCLLFRFSGSGRYWTTSGLFALCVAVIFIIFLPGSIVQGQLNHLISIREVQDIYIYSNAAYYITNRQSGIFRMSSDGIVSKIVDAESIRIGQGPESTFYAKGKMCYYKSKGVWRRINLDTNEIEEYPQFEKERWRVGTLRDPVDNSEGIPLDCVVIGDGYIYFSTERGLFRAKLDRRRKERLIEGNISVFDIRWPVVTYYDRKLQKVLKQDLRSVPRENRG